MKEREENIIKRIKELALLMGADCQETSTLNSLGRSSDKIVIEYNVSDNK
tara:strand:+ start:708 stop:857 length:150 start_codon:yes stop_codon:yes gene_type:complete